MNRKHNEHPSIPDLKIGEVNGDMVGCYLLWFVQDGDSERSYQSLATSFDGLEEDYVSFFSEIVAWKKKELEKFPDPRPPSETFRTSDGGLSMPKAELIRNSHEHDLSVAENCLKHVEWIDMHFHRGTDKPFIIIGGMQIWLGKGVRRRQKVGGKYLE